MTCRRGATGVVRKPWTANDEKELRGLFASFFKTGECPGQQDCVEAMKISKAQNGSIHTRPRDNIKKKVNNMIIKERK